MRKLHLNKKNRFALLLFCAAVFSVFFYIAYRTPLAGDDWGYALNGMSQNPIKGALEFYNSWSGRFFSELWGFVVAPRKWLWNILNPVLFVTAYFCMALICHQKKNNYVVILLLIFTMMLNINSDLRMETYSWIMGSTYVIPLSFSLVCLFIWLNNFDSIDNIPLWEKVIVWFLCFYIGLTMENIAAVLVFAELLLLIHYYLDKRRVSKVLLVSILISTLSFVIMRSSPGSYFRLMRDHAEFNALPLFEKILRNMPAFIQYSFVENKFTIFFFIVGLGGLLIFSRPENLPRRSSLIGLLYLGVSVILLFIRNIASVLHMERLLSFSDSSSKFVWLYWILFVLVAFIIVGSYVENQKRKNKILLFIVLAGSSNLIMMVSPIFGARSSLYFVYFIIVATALIWQEWIEKGGKLMALLVLLLVALSGLRVREYYYKYTMVSEVQREREEIIRYYQDHSDITEIYIPRMPIYSVHGGDIEEGDDYHFETFKEYYGLNPEAEVYFYWKDSY